MYPNPITAIHLPGQYEATLDAVRLLGGAMREAARDTTTMGYRVLLSTQTRLERELRDYLTGGAK
jgi:hypothetical protein